MLYVFDNSVWPTKEVIKIEMALDGVFSVPRAPAAVASLDFKLLKMSTIKEVYVND